MNQKAHLTGGWVTTKTVYCSRKQFSLYNGSVHSWNFTLHQHISNTLQVYKRSNVWMKLFTEVLPSWGYSFVGYLLGVYQYIILLENSHEYRMFSLLEDLSWVRLTFWAAISIYFWWTNASHTGGNWNYRCQIHRYWGMPVMEFTNKGQELLAMDTLAAF